MTVLGWNLRSLAAELFPESAEKNEGFRQELLGLSHNGLEALGGLTAVSALILMAGWLAVAPGHGSTPARILIDGALVVLGSAVVWLARSGRLYDNARRAALAASQLTALILVNGSLWLGTVSRSAEDFIPSQLALTSLSAVVLLPLRPIQALANSIAVTVIYAGSVALAQRTYAPSAGVQPDYLLFMGSLAALSTGLAAALYSRRRSAYFAFLETIRASSDLRVTQQRLSAAEAALSTTRLAAAISHELNTPLGALRSSVDTLLLLAARQATAPPEQMERLVRLQADIRKTIQESSGRLQQIGARLARFTNLDQAERQPAKLHELLADVLELVRPHLKPEVLLVANAGPVPPTFANPQQISAVLYDLMNNAAAAIDGPGRVEVSCQEEHRSIRITISDTGRGIPPERLASIFDPSFQTAAGRVSSANWSMFNARQVIREHGGDIRIESKPGSGTAVTVTLPVRGR